MIYTTYYANLRNLPDSVTPVAISSSVPDGINIMWLPRLAPTYAARADYKQDRNRDKFRTQYFRWLEQVDLNEVVHKLPSGDVALVCYEKNPLECHRSLLAELLREKLNLEVKEWGCIS